MFLFWLSPLSIHTQHATALLSAIRIGSTNSTYVSSNQASYYYPTSTSKVTTKLVHVKYFFASAYLSERQPYLLTGKLLGPHTTSTHISTVGSRFGSQKLAQGTKNTRAPLTLAETASHATYRQIDNPQPVP